jgi:hypothetical protein
MTAHAKGVIDQSFEGPANLFALLNEGFKHSAQTFTAGVGGNLTEVNLAISSTSSYSMRVAIHDMVGGVPAPTELAYTLVAPENLSGSWQDFFNYDITFSPGVPITAETEYAIVVTFEEPAAGDGQGYWAGSFPGSYARGQQCAGGPPNLPEGSWQCSSSYDLFFRTYVSSLNATAISDSQINLDWIDNAADETSYHVERSPDGATNWTEIATLGANATSYNDTDLTCATPYYYRVRAYWAVGDLYSAYSNIAQATTLACPPILPAPTNLNATATSASQINLDWEDNATDETSYHVERSPDGATNWAEIATLGADAISYNDTGLVSATPYFYRVRAYRAGDDLYSAYSDTAEATTDSLLFLPIVLGP